MGHAPVAVVTAPDKPAGRGMHLHLSPVKEYAIAKNLPVLQPEKLKNLEFLQQLASYKADLQIVVAFRMLPEAVWNMPPLGSINVHASLLPQYRGAAPINWAIINGEAETGVTIFKLKHEIDTGNIFSQEKVLILPEDNAGSLHDKLMNAGAALLVKTIAGIENGTIKEIPQNDFHGEIKHAPKLTKESLRIDWNMPVAQVHNLIRGLSPYPAAHSQLAGKLIKIFASHYETVAPAHTAGEYETDHNSYLRFATQDGWLYIDELQQEGKKRLDIKTFLRGFRG